MVHGQQENVIIRRDTQDLCAHDWPRTQIEGKPGFFVRAYIALEFSLLWRQRREIDNRDQQNKFARNRLYWLAVMQDKTGPQSFVARDHPVDRPLQCADIELAAQAHLLRHVVERIARIELVKEPEPLLGEAQRKIRAGGNPWNRR